MAAAGASWMLRFGALLFSVVVAGGLIGFTWEQAAYEATPEVPEFALPLGPEQVAPPPPGPSRSPEEQAVLQRALSHFPPYPRGSRPEVLAADYLGPSAPIAVAWLSTSDPADKVLEHYRQVLEAQGLPPLGLRYNANAGFVGYWEPGTDEVYLVSVLAQQGETLVFVSAGQVGSLLEGTGNVPEWVPLPPRIEQRAGLSLSLEGATQYTVSAVLPGGPLEEAVEAYRSLAAGQGWSVRPSASSVGEGRELELRRGSIQGTASLRRGAEAPEIHLFLSFLERP
jgi:hypothetical protein